MLCAIHVLNFLLEFFVLEGLVSSTTGCLLLGRRRLVLLRSPWEEITTALCPPEGRAGPALAACQKEKNWSES